MTARLECIISNMEAFGILEKGASIYSIYCESGIGIFSTQPINTISNVALLIAAYFAYRFVLIKKVKDRTLKMLPFIISITGIGSMMWHGIPHPLTNFADTLPISTFVLVSLFLFLEKLLEKKALVWKIFLAFILVEIPFMFDLVPSFNGLLPYSIVLVFGAFLVFGLIRKYKSLTPDLVIIISLFATALIFRTLDLMICPVFSVGTHFIWHIINALVFYLVVRVLVLLNLKSISIKR